MKTNYIDFEQHVCWKTATAVRRMAGELTGNLPDEEKDHLVKDIRYNSRLLTRNISQGLGWFPEPEALRYFLEARGVLFILIDMAITARDEQYIAFREYEGLRKCIDHAIQSLEPQMEMLKIHSVQSNKPNNCHLPLTINF